jgi:hypothetical protein
MFDPPIEALCRGGWIMRRTRDVIANTNLSIVMSSPPTIGRPDRAALLLVRQPSIR